MMVRGRVRQTNVSTERVVWELQPAERRVAEVMRYKNAAERPLHCSEGISSKQAVLTCYRPPRGAAGSGLQVNYVGPHPSLKAPIGSFH